MNLSKDGTPVIVAMSTIAMTPTVAVGLARPANFADSLSPLADVNSWRPDAVRVVVMT